MKKLFIFTLTLIIFCHAKAQTNSGSITTPGWYRIAINGPLTHGGSGGTRAAARFILRDVTSSFHQTVEFLAYIHYGNKPSIVVLNNSYYTSGTPPFVKIRLLQGNVYEGAAIEIYVYGTNGNAVAYYLQDNDQINGWTAVDWQQVSTGSGDNDGVPTGFTPRIINLQNLVKGYVTNEGAQQSFYNGNLYVSGNILVNKTSQTNTNYKLDINGDARVNKIVVNTSGADYVFDSTYQLISLDSLSHYIKANRHLPNIPSAAEMQKEGLNVGDNQMKLLQKIEELTKYVMAQQKMIKNQQKEIIKLSQQVKIGKKNVLVFENKNKF